MQDSGREGDGGEREVRGGRWGGGGEGEVGERRKWGEGWEEGRWGGDVF